LPFLRLKTGSISEIEIFHQPSAPNDGNDDLNPLVDSGDVIGRQFESACQFPQLGCIL